MEAEAPKKSGKWKLWIAIILILPVLGIVLYTWVTLNWSYSKGDRAGYVQKFSQKGWLCKTWEGEIMMMAAPGTIPEKFFFSVRSDAIAVQINKTLGKRVSLTYEQHKGVPSSCFGETEYFVTDVKSLE
jgi:hypothetical protein